MPIRKSFHGIKSYDHKKYDFSVLSNVVEYFEENDSNILLFKSLLNAESVSLWNNTNKISNPEKTKLLYNDYVKYITLYRINKFNFCGENFGSKLSSLIFVFSRVDAFKQRNAIRKTWAKNMNIEKSETKVLFVIALSFSESIQNRVIEEDEKHNDLIQWEFIDNYYNCTLKAIGILRWTLFYCKNVKFIMKTDDDILINPLMFNQFIANKRNSKNTIYGNLVKRYKPHRSKTSKWFISYESYSSSIYPDFMLGPYIISNDSIYPIYIEILNSLPALAFDDVYISGVIAEKLNISRVKTNYFVKFDWRYIKSRRIDFKRFNSKVFFAHNIGYNHMIAIWDKFNLTLN
jgi:beta-1,3-galactosyltransferase 1